MATVAGRNAQALRKAAGLTLAEVAKAAKSYGLAWTTGRVAAFESGRVSPTLPTLIAVAVTLADVAARPISLVDLFAGDGRVIVTDNLTLELANVRAALGGKTLKPPTVSDVPGGNDDLAEALFSAALEVKDELGGLKFKPTIGDLRAASKQLAEFADADLKVTKSLGATRLATALAMTKLWGQTFVAERDRRAGSEANAQRKGRVARELKDELRKWLDGNGQ